MLEVLTGTGLASAAGLNAYVPLLAVGLLARYTDALPLSASWQWLEHPVVLGIVALLLVVELVADKIPAVDSVNDVIQTFVRPTSGGITFGAGASAITTDEIAAAGTGDGSWWPVVCGIVIALVFHGLKALARPVLNTVTAGAGAPVISTVEDVISTVVSVLAILLPVIILVVTPLSIAAIVWVWRARRRRRRRDAAGEAAGDAAPA
ncbi:DUF4126 domain-containing protein [Marinitenerispora sediminis]|uniref:DUF4126 domain-containing protein n=1 Tax=Marinitenerispora sediminis TaxID=1931232 RepID=A0A368T8B6_9ACTN|nr:DUF4126 domain-containing protein [Marinitenerispora sediminis]RCV52628.1 DUF4126 domain-containing protein [Marinitenerispora sediminis]RCV60335.1 DUF4126 domain-containing protein [Marinitenerispora sediminis]RCV60588.1 DUF4126 domain-containing protein [Marinitenerispora sediminis]